MDTPANGNTEERMRILRMLEENKLTAEQAAWLLAAVGQGQPAAVAEERPTTGQRFFRVRVTDTFTGKAKASVTIPMGLMEWGLKIGAQFAPQVNNVNLNELSDLLRGGLEGKIVDVVDEEDGEHVEIFVD